LVSGAGKYIYFLTTTDERLTKRNRYYGQFASGQIAGIAKPEQTCRKHRKTIEHVYPTTLIGGTFGSKINCSFYLGRSGLTRHRCFDFC
jgi:hypothetical protein